MDIMGHVSSDGESSLVSGLVQLPLTLSLGADDGMPRFPDKTCFYGCSDADGWGPMSLKYADFTPCFLQGFVGTLVAVTTIGCALWYSYSLCSKAKKRHNRLTGYFFIKLSLIGISTFFQLVLVHSTPTHDSVRVGHILDIFAMLAVVALTVVQQFTSSTSSGVVLFYWLWEVVLNMSRVYGLALRNKLEDSDLVLYNVSLISQLILTVCILFAELYFPIVPKKFTPRKERISPFDTANVFSRISFSWMDKLMAKGYSNFLTEDDLPPLPHEIKSGVTSSGFNKYWNLQKSKGNKPTLFYAISMAFGGEVLIGSIFKVAMDVLGFVQPQLLRILIRFVNQYSEDTKGDIPLNKGFMIATAMFVVLASQTFFAHQYYQRSFDMGQKIKTSLTAVIYSKSLVLSSEARQKSSTGDIVNLMAVDVQRLQDLVQNIQIIWSGPFQIILCLFSLYNLLGALAWVALFVMLILIPINSQIAGITKTLHRIQMKNKDERSSLISEIVNNIKSLKFYNWEGPYLSKLTYIRNEKELKNLKKISVFSAISIFTAHVSPFLVSCTTFGIFLLLDGKDLTLLTDIVFPALSLFNLLNLPLSVLPLVISNIVESQVAISRITNFLTATEIQPNAVSKLPRVGQVGEVSVRVQGGDFKWSSSESLFALSGVNLECKKGDLDCIVGRVGSGKSALIQAILGDLQKVAGKVEVHGSVAFVSQVPWIINGTVRENILFGHKFNSEWYEEVVSACALTSDFLTLNKGDQTEVGEKGISLSGGQKARLALARAVYSGADVYLLDDTLSAVDEHVGKHLMDHVLGPQGLLQSKTRILATNSIKVLGISNCIHLVSDGKIVEQGSYSSILQNGGTTLLSQLILEFGKKNNGSSSEVASTVVSSTASINNDGYISRRGSIVGSIVRENLDLELALEEDLEEEEVVEDEESISLLDTSRKEHIEQGEVKWDVYLAYIKACNPVAVTVFVTTTFLAILISVLSNVWLKHWSEINTFYGSNPHLVYYLVIYILLGVGSSLLVLVQTLILWIYCTIAGSKKLHSDMAFSVIRAPMSFFETTPVGRILNRFSNDIYKVDELMGRMFGLFFINLARVLFTILVICFSTWPFIFVILPLGIFYYHTQQYYLRTSRELRRLDSVTRSPIFSNFQESLNGVSVIRAYGQLNRFKDLNRIAIDRNMSAFNPAVNANRWLAVRLEFLGSIIIYAASGLSIIVLKNGGVTASTVGLSVSYALQITQSLGTIVRMTVEVETNIVSVERILEYSQLTPEAPEIILDNRPATNWPQQGKIEFKNYLTKYRPELDPVLKDINLEIKPKEKIGIVGRTGAGKSSLTLALFRIIEATTGEIHIDQLDVGKIGLSDLRHNLSIIPQDSQVFQGTIRSNLDPTNTFSDEKIWKALELSHLNEHIIKMQLASEADSALDVEISEGGSNLSVGQRQLMCLARALLIQSPILVLDEATAAVDVETDQILQETIRREFLDRTIITIAHRLNTILDSDRILVLEKGKIAECDTPKNLLKNTNSLFYSLCKEGGFLDEEE